MQVTVIMAPPTCTPQEKVEDERHTSDGDASSEEQSSPSLNKDVFTLNEVTRAESGAAVQEIIPVSEDIAEMNLPNLPEVFPMELDTNLPNAVRGPRRRKGFKRNQEARSLFQYFTSS